METFSALLALSVYSPHKGQWRWALMFSFICAWTNGWVSNWCAGDLRRHRAHYDITVMFFNFSIANTGPGDYRIIAGNINRNRQSQVRDVLEMIPHESYNTRLYEHDIALLRIAPLNLNNDARTICIPAAGSDTAIGTMLTASGWGNLDTGNSKSPWWRHQMETFSALLALCAGNSPVTGEFPSQRPVTRSFVPIAV